MTRKCLFHIGGNQYSPLPAEHHTFQIWEALSKDFDEYHVFARSKNMKFSHTQQGKIHLHLIHGFGKRRLLQIKYKHQLTLRKKTLVVFF